MVWRRMHQMSRSWLNPLLFEMVTVAGGRLFGRMAVKQNETAAYECFRMKKLV